jgi:hypothetical protein
MALRLFREHPITEEESRIMQSQSKREEPAKRPQPTQDRGKPASYAAYALRKDVTVRVSVAPMTVEADELREHGYGHGV